MYGFATKYMQMHLVILQVCDMVEKGVVRAVIVLAVSWMDRGEMCFVGVEAPAAA